MSFNALIDAARYSLYESIELFLPTKFISLAGILTFILLNLTYKVRKDEDETNAFYDNRNINPNLIDNLSLLLIQKQIRRLTIED